MVKPFDNKLNKNLDCFTTSVQEVLNSDEDARPQPTLSQRTTAVLRGLDLVLEHHGAPSLIREELSNQLHSYLDNSLDETVWLKRTKDVLTYPFSDYLRNPRPPMPDRRFEPSGPLRRWLKARCNAFNRKNTHFWYSWYQSKRSTLPLSKDFVQQSYVKHFETLTKGDHGSDDVINAIMEMPIFDKLLCHLRDNLTDSVNKAPPFTESTPSGGASFESSRKWGGQYGQLFEEAFPDLRDLPRVIKKAGLETPDNLYKTPLSTDLWSMKCYPRITDQGVTYFNKVIEMRSSYGWEEWNSLRYDQVQQDLLNTHLSGDLPSCTIQAILEPNKARIISKEWARLQYYNKMIQKLLHTDMRKYDCFRLIGRPMSPTDLIDLAEKAGPKWKWFSIDYSAATDGLSAKYSMRILSRLVEKLAWTKKSMAEYSLGPHELFYPSEDENGNREVHRWGTMNNGQLMGGILSFIILCLANLGLYLLVTEQNQIGWSDCERLRHVLVNGDDMVYAAPEELWERHVELGSKIGLEMSVGKAYVHDTYININSTSYHYDLKKIYKEYEELDYNKPWIDQLIHPEFSKCYGKIFFNDLREPLRVRSHHTPYQIDYLNTGLFYGQHKVQGEMDAELADDFVPYKLEDYSNHKDDLSFQQYEKLVRLGYSAQFSDLHKLIKGEKTFWDSKNLSYRNLKRLLDQIGVDGEFDNLVSSLNTVLQGSLPGKQKDLLCKFITHNKENLKKECLGLRELDGKMELFTRNLFIPIPLGGFGINPPLGFKTKTKEVQRAVARCCLYRLSHSNKIKLSSQRPLPGYEIEKIDQVQSVPWQRRIADICIYESYTNSDCNYNMNKDKLLSFNAIRYGENPSSYCF